jgi:hypothetical protein
MPIDDRDVGHFCYDNNKTSGVGTSGHQNGSHVE